MAKMTGGLPWFSIWIVVALMPIALKLWNVPQPQLRDVLTIDSLWGVGLGVLLFLAMLIAAPTRIYNDQVRTIDDLRERRASAEERLRAVEELSDRQRHGYKLLVRWTSSPTEQDKRQAREESIGPWLIDMQERLAPWGPHIVIRFNVPRGVPLGISEPLEQAVRLTQLGQIIDEIADGDLQTVNALLNRDA
jgi:hypothetical protein